jgi:hypothetical protein
METVSVLISFYQINGFFQKCKKYKETRYEVFLCSGAINTETVSIIYCSLSNGYISWEKEKRSETFNLPKAINLCIQK